MTRRYLRKIKSSKEEKSSKKISNNKVALNLEVEKAMGPQERVIILDDKPNNYSKKKALHESIRNALDAAGNTALAIRFFNLYVEKSVSKIDKTKKLYMIPYVEIKTSDSHGLKNTKKSIKIPINHLTTKEKKEFRDYFTNKKNLRHEN